MAAKCLWPFRWFNEFHHSPLLSTQRDLKGGGSTWRVTDCSISAFSAERQVIWQRSVLFNGCARQRVSLHAIRWSNQSRRKIWIFLMAMSFIHLASYRISCWPKAKVFVRNGNSAAKFLTRMATLREKDICTLITHASHKYSTRWQGHVVRLWAVSSTCYSKLWRLSARLRLACRSFQYYSGR